MPETWEDRYREGLRNLLETQGSVIAVSDRGYGEPDEYVNPYGWSDWDATKHLTAAPKSHYEKARDGCRLIIPQGATVTERTYSEFAGTFEDNENVVGLNAYPAHCACGELKDVYVRWEGSIADALAIITGVPTGSDRKIQL